SHCVLKNIASFSHPFQFSLNVSFEFLPIVHPPYIANGRINKDIIKDVIKNETFSIFLISTGSLNCSSKINFVISPTDKTIKIDIKIRNSIFFNFLVEVLYQFQRQLIYSFFLLYIFLLINL